MCLSVCGGGLRAGGIEVGVEMRKRDDDDRVWYVFPRLGIQKGGFWRLEIGMPGDWDAG